METTTSIRLRQCLTERDVYAASFGGYTGIHEADDDFNKLNIRIVQAIKKHYGKAYIGKINYYGNQRAGIVNGTMEVYEEYHGQKLFTGCCDFCVPVKNETLEKMIRHWNQNADGFKLENIINRIHVLDGEYIFWT